MNHHDLALAPVSGSHGVAVSAVGLEKPFSFFWVGVWGGGGLQGGGDCILGLGFPSAMIASLFACVQTSLGTLLG